MTDGTIPEIVIVGAGPTGLTLACQLLRRGVNCTIFEAESGPTTHTRAIGLSARSLEVLDEFDGAERIIANGLPSSRAIFYSDKKKIGELSADGLAHTRFPFLLSIPQADVEAGLVEAVEELGGSVRWSTPVTGLEVRESGGVALSVGVEGEQRTLDFDWVVGADGAHSIVREAAGIDFVGDPNGFSFVNVDAHLADGPEPGVGHYYFHREGFLVVAPMPNDVYRITATVNPDDLGTIDIDDIRRLLSRRADEQADIVDIFDSGWGIRRFAVQTRLAERFVKGRVVLAGDAAHLYGPTGAQGMNGGIQDAHALAWRLAAGDDAVRRNLVEEYGAERKAVASGTMHHVEMQTKAATMTSRPLIAGRDAFLKMASNRGLLDTKVAPRISQFDIKYDLDEDHGPMARIRARSSLVGARLPDVAVSTGGRDTRLYRLLGPGMAAILIDGGPDGSHRIDDAVRGLERFGHGLKTIVTSRGPTTRPGHVSDPNGVVAGLFGVTEPTVVLVRPDRHVAAVAAVGSDDLLDVVLQPHVDFIRSVRSHDAPSETGSLNR